MFIPGPNQVGTRGHGEHVVVRWRSSQDRQRIPYSQSHRRLQLGAGDISKGSVEMTSPPLDSEASPLVEYLRRAPLMYALLLSGPCLTIRLL